MTSKILDYTERKIKLYEKRRLEEERKERNKQIIEELKLKKESK